MPSNHNPNIVENSNVNLSDFSINPPSFDNNLSISIRVAFGKALLDIGIDERIVSLDADTQNSTMSILFQQKYPDRFIDCFIAEQNMIGTALGISKRNKVPFISAFSAFLTRCYDQIRLSAISEGNLKFIGSHSGVSVGEDGASQIGLEDLAMFRAIPGSLVLYPSDGISMYYAVQLVANRTGICYIRSSRPSLPIIYTDRNIFTQRSYIIKKSIHDRICIIAAGVTLHEAIKAWEILKVEGIFIRVIDLFCVKPIDTKRIAKHIKECDGIAITVEDHYESGGIFEAVCASVCKFSLRVFGLYVKEIPHSGTFEELIDKYEINSKFIISKVKDILFSIN